MMRVQFRLEAEDLTEVVEHLPEWVHQTVSLLLRVIAIEVVVMKVWIGLAL